MVEVIKIDDVEYVRKDNLSAPAESFDGMEYKIFRTYSSGVFAGYLAKVEDGIGHYKCTIKRARRIHKWSGAASLSQLAEDGVKDVSNCRFAKEISGELKLPNVIEIIDVTEKARKNIAEVPVWTA